MRAPDYQRRYVGLGVVAHATHRTTLGGASKREDLRPFVEAGRARFRIESGQASTVSVIGSWDDWTSPGRALSRTRDPGVWEAWVAVPPGVHHYRFLVDGRAVRPPDAPRYEKDDFGGEDGVIVVTGTPP